jgi:eukaryotic-like serine/threonine-protein kinase
VQDNKRTKIGPTGPVRPVTGVGSAVAATTTPAPVTPAPTTDPPAQPSTSYLPPQVDPLLGQTLAGRYQIQKKLGEGGMGAVYLATHNLLEKQVALKVLHGEFARKPDLVERFMQEAKAASRIRHENVIDVSDFGTTPEGLVFFAMELLKGHDLHEEVARARLAAQRLPWGRSKKIFLQICAALSAAHALGIVHRDLKPENIYLVDFLGEPDFVKLLDFGIAKQTEVAEGDRKLTRTGMLFGTPEYMSPEQARGETVDLRVDVYAMGCILYQLVTGKVPFEAENFMGVLSLHLTEPPPAIAPEAFDAIGAPRALADVIVKALEKDRNQRFATIDELARAVRLVSGDKPTGPVVAQASVPAPSSSAASPGAVTGAITGSTGRVKTQWTGNLSIPEVDAVPAPRTSRRPMILGAIVLAGGAAGAAALLVSRGGAPHGDPTSVAGAAIAGPGTASPGPSAAVAPVAPVAPAVPPVAPPAPPAAPALTFEWAQIRLDSTPPGADVKDLTNGTLIGHTPFTFKVRPSHNARQFALHHKDHVDAVVELVPDRPKVDYTEKLVRIAGGSGAGRTATDPRLPPPAKGSAAPPDLATLKPEPPTVKPEPPVPAGSAAVRPVKPPDEDCDPPCLKADPTRSGGTGGSAP